MHELFEIFDDDGNPRGLAARPRVHTLGLWHKSAHVFLFDSQDKLYVQLRAADKDLYPDLWDYSVGEHLQPGEGFHDAALRGLMEELGVEGVSVQALGAIRPSRFEIAELGLRDHELQQAYRAIYDGAIHPDPVEVAEVRRTPLAELARWIDDEPERFTPWFLRDLHELGLLPHES